MLAKTLTTILFSLALATGPTAQQPPHEQHGGQHDGAQPHMEHRFEDAERYARSFDDPARDAWQIGSDRAGWRQRHDGLQPVLPYDAHHPAFTASSPTTPRRRSL